LFWCSRESANGVGSDYFEFVGDYIGHVVVFFQSYVTKILLAEGSEQFSACPVEVFPEYCEHSRDSGAIRGVADPFFPAFSMIVTLAV
jgi:hypothetical protein